MSVRFVIGRAGTGKTRHCLASIRQEVQASPVTGPSLVMLVPEQASMQMERMVLAPPISAVSRAQVLSFTRLAHRILASNGTPTQEALSSTARAMVLRRIVAQLAPSLRYYRRTDRFAGFLDRLGRSIGELIEEAISPDDLRGVCDNLVDDQQRSAKFTDLCEIYEAYLTYLGDTLFDPTQYLDLACEALAQGGFLQGAHIWVDGFAGFTGSQMNLITALALRAKGMDISLLMDPKFLAASKDDGQASESDLFAKPHRTYLRIRRILASAGIIIDDPKLLTSETPRRFGASTDLAELEQALCHGRPAPERSRKDIRIIRLEDNRSEVEFAIAQVCSLVEGDAAGYRYRDIAIIVRDLEPYHDLLASGLTERGIPYFIDRRRTIVHHAAVEFIRTAIAVAVEDFSVESVRLLIKSGLCGLDEIQSDALENYVLACGIAGRPLWSGADWSFDANRDSRKVASATAKEKLKRVNAARTVFLDGLLEFASNTSAGTGSDWATRMRQLLNHKSVPEQIERWAVIAEAEGEVAQAAEHRQVWVVLEGFLDDLERALGEEVISLPELRSIVEAGLADLTLGLVPPTVDQVLVGSIERSRHPELKAVILLGFNEGTFPRVSSEDAVINDDDRDALREQGMTVGVTRRQTILDERLLVYVALTRPGNKLVMTYAMANAEGSGLRPSPYVETIKSLLPGLEVRTFAGALRSRAMWSLMNVEDLSGALAGEMRHRPKLETDDPNVRARWNDLYSLARSSYVQDRRVSQALSALAYENRAALGARSVDSMIGTQWVASVSELESFAACPFQRFARYGLRLRERREAKLELNDLGTVQHAILEEFINACAERGDAFADIDADDVLPRLQTIADEFNQDWSELSGQTSARDAYLLARSARELSPVVKSQQRVVGAGKFKPKAAELKFGFSDESEGLPPLELNTPKGRVVRIRGLIDRVDLAELSDETVGIVIDYKRTRDKRFDVSRAYHGLSLQLLGYLLLLADRGTTLAGRPIQPLGAFYVSLLQKYESVDHPTDAGEQVEGKDAPPRGILNADRIADLDTGVPDDGRSSVFNVYRKKGGELGYKDSSDGAEAREFEGLLAHTRYKLGELADGVIDGNVAVSPYRLKDFSPCQWCEVRSVCRFEFGNTGMRHLPKLKRTQVFTQIGGTE